MRRAFAGMLATFALVVLTGSVAQAIPRPWPTDDHRGQPTTVPSIVQPVAPMSPAAEWLRWGATVTPTPCDDDPSFLCGSVPVPFDRADPDGRQIDIAFRILPHSDPSSTRSDPVFISDGGPGYATTYDPYFWSFILDPLTDQRDLVMIDQRGTGGSGAIRCRDLQDGWDGTESFFRAIRRCAVQLGDAADRYGSGDIARDVEAVRKALGYDRINYFAGSYGTVVEQAYGTRFPQRLRSIVADAGLPVTDPAHAWGWGSDQPVGHERAAVLGCERAPSCAALHTDPEGLFEALIDRLADDPIEGWAHDLFGTPRYIEVDAEGLGLMTFDVRVASEITAAADALLSRGDEAPLLRLGAETLFPVGRQGPPRIFSMGANIATYCNDQDFVFDRTATEAVRRQQYADARAALPPDAFAPWTVDTWDPSGFSALCAGWAAPDRFVPALPSGAPPIDVPTLVLEGDLDTDVPIETNERMAEMFADPVIVRVEGAGHITTGWSQCARDLATRFIDTLAVADTSCADTPSVVLQGQALFPRTVDEALEATPRAGDESTRRRRKIAWSTAQTVLDAWLRSFRQPAAVADGSGLRGGGFHVDYARFDDHAVLHLHDARLVRDVAVHGRSTLSYDFEHPRLEATVQIHGAGTADGTLHIVGRYWFDTFFGALRVSGEIGKRHVEVSVPGN